MNDTLSIKVVNNGYVLLHRTGISGFTTEEVVLSKQDLLIRIDELLQNVGPKPQVDTP